MELSNFTDLVDHELLWEIEVTIDLIEAAAAVDDRLGQSVIDEVLGVSGRTNR